MANQRAVYEYITLQQAQELALDPSFSSGSTRNLFALVTECTAPRPTQGTGPSQTNHKAPVAGTR